jgi:hypothetical protein
LSRIASSGLCEVRALDPVILLTGVILALATACVAIVVRARRASQIDPCRHATAVVGRWSCQDDQ